MDISIIFLLLILFLSIFFINNDLIMAKDISNCLLNEGTSLIINSDGTVSKYLDGKLISENIEAKKYSYFLLNYFELKYNSTTDKMPLMIKLPSDETLIYVNPTVNKYNSETESGKMTIFVTWENSNPNFITLGYGNIFANFIINLQHSLKFR